MDSAQTLVVTAHDLGTVVETVGADRFMDELVASLTDALRSYDESTTRVIKRDGFAYQHPQPGVLEWMPVMVAGHQAVIKVVAYNPGNPNARGMPTVVSTINVFDVATGRLVALLDGTLPTALRTGAASAVATRILARSEKSVVGLVGCGAQAVTQLHAINRVCDVQQVLVYDIDPSVTASFADRVSFLRLPVRSVPRDELERESDVICTATSAKVGAGPVVGARDFKPWVHVNAVGSDLPGKTELPADFLRRSLVCPDFVEQALVEGEAQQLGADSLGPTLSALVKNADDFECFREQPTVFDSTGFAVEDLVVAELFLAHVSALQLGRTVPIDAGQRDPKNPYAELDLRARPQGSGRVESDVPLAAAPRNVVS